MAIQSCSEFRQRNQVLNSHIEQVLDIVFFLEEAIPLEEVTFLDQGFNLERSSTVLSAASTPGSWGNELMGRSGGYSTALATDTITVFILFFAFVLCLDSGDQKVVCFTLPSIVSCL